MSNLELVVMICYWPITLWWGFGKVKSIREENESLSRRSRIAPDPKPPDEEAGKANKNDATAVEIDTRAKAEALLEQGSCRDDRRVDEGADGEGKVEAGDEGRVDVASTSTRDFLVQIPASPGPAKAGKLEPLSINPRIAT